MDDGILRFPKVRGLPVGRLAPAPMSGTDGGYPWVDGELLYAADLNAAIAGAGVTASAINVLDQGAKGDGSTDDTNALQVVLNTYRYGKATIYIPDTGSPYMTGVLVVWSGTDIVLEGTLKLRPGATNALLNINNASNVTVRGHGTLDGNGAAQTITGAGALGAYQATNVQIEGITIQNAYNWNVNITASTNVRLDRVTIQNCLSANEFAQGCTNCWITNSYISNITDDGGFGFYGGVTNSGITDCTVTGAFATGIYIRSDSAQTAFCSNLVIANNIVHGCNTGGISADTDGTLTGVHTGITITGNRCYGNNNVGNHQYADIWLDFVSGATVAGNSLSGSGSGSLPTWGVFVSTHSSHVNIIGNTIWNEGQGGTAGSGVYIQAANDVLVEGNHIYDSQTTHTMSSAIAGDAGARNAIIGNLFGTLGGAAIALALASDTMVSDLSGQIVFQPEGIGPPTFTTRSVGTRLVLYPAVAPASGDYAIGIDPGSLWQSVPVATNGYGFQWYGGTTLVGELYGNGNLWISGNQFQFGALPTNAANDAAAATAGVPVGGVYRNGGVMMVRVA